MPLMQMVPLLMKEENKENCEDYEPQVVSFGPYHHGKEKLKFVEDFKRTTAVKMFIGDDRNKADFMAAILGEIEYAKSCYLEEFTCRYTDIEFAHMMLRDACLILNYFGPTEIEKSCKEAETISQHLGIAVYISIRRDMYLLENQIPFRILEILVHLKYHTHREDFIKEIEKLSFRMFYKDRTGNIEEAANQNNMLGQSALHLVEILRRVIVTGKDRNYHKNDHSCFCNINTLLSCCCRCEDDHAASNRKENRFYLLRSVTDLKSKGIHFRASQMQSLKGIRLRPSKFGLSAELQLPCLYVDMFTRVFFKNVMAYEFSPHLNYFDHSVSVYVTLMKRFVASKEDVKELRDKGIIINQLESDEQVVQLYKDMNTYGADDDSTLAFMIFWKDMESHFNSNAKMWIADFKTKYFDNPWTTFALAGSIFFMFMDIVQTYFAAVPPASTK